MSTGVSDTAIQSGRNSPKGSAWGQSKRELGLLATHVLVAFLQQAIYSAPPSPSPLDAAPSISHIKMIVPAAVLKQLRTSPDSVEETDEETKRLELYTVRLLLACCYCSGASTVCTI